MVFLGACYFFIYVPSNEKNVQEQRFRSLQNIDRNIHTKIENGVAMLNLLIKAYNDEPSKRDSLKAYIANYASDKFRLSQPELIVLQEQKGFDSLDVYKVLVNKITGNITLV